MLKIVDQLDGSNTQSVVRLNEAVFSPKRFRTAPVAYGTNSATLAHPFQPDSM